MINNKQALLWFLCGASAFHAITHVFYWASGALPLDFKLFVVDNTLNNIELWGSVLLAVVFGYFAKKS